MAVSVTALYGALRTPEGRKLLRYSMVSVVSVGVSTAVLLFCSGVLSWSGVVSNTVATAVAAIPSYELNRKWAWGKTGQGHLFKEVIPFWALAFIGWAFSTLCVAVAEHQAQIHHFSHLERTGVVGVTSVAAFGILWVVKFIIFNKVLFAHRPVPVEALDGRAGVPS